MSNEKLKGNAVLKVADEQHSTVYTITALQHFTLNKDNAENYLADARMFLDELSTEFNQMGIFSFIGALLYTVLVEGYFGKNNKQRKRG